jgi:hypothetical protein
MQRKNNMEKSVSHVLFSVLFAHDDLAMAGLGLALHGSFRMIWFSASYVNLRQPYI